jgi:hypothetical protein
MERHRIRAWLLAYGLVAVLMLEGLSLAYPPVARHWEVALNVPQVRTRSELFGIDFRITPEHCSLAADYEALIGPLPPATRWRSVHTKECDIIGIVCIRASGNNDAYRNYEQLSFILRERLQGSPWVVTSSGLSKPAAKKILSEFMALAKQKGAEHTDCASYLQAVIRAVGLVHHEVREVDVPTADEVLDLSVWQRDWEPRILKAEQGM